MRSVIETFEWCGWRVYHAEDSRLDTMYGETGKGFPDLVCARGGRVVVIETKAERGQLAPEQLIWLGLFMQCAGVEVYTLRPHDIDKAHEIAK